MKKITAWFLLILLFASCERYDDVNFKLPFKSKLVSVCFIEEGSADIQLALTRTTPVIGNPYPAEPNYVPDATVIMKTPGQSYTLTYDPISRLYETTMPEQFEEGKTYSIEIAQGNETITGFTQIPPTVTPYASIRLDSVSDNGTYSYLVNITCGIREAGKHNISVHAQMVYEDSSVVPMMAYEILSKPVNRIGEGETITRTFISGFSSEFIRPVRVDVIVMLCDDPYTIYNNNLSGVDWNSSGTPVGEPNITYGTMSNRIGVLGAYRYLPGVSVHLK